LLFIANTEKAAMMKPTDAEPAKWIFLSGTFQQRKLGSRAKMHK